MSDQHLRLSDAEREAAAGRLSEHYVQGRLSAEEHGERLDRIWAARTRGEVTPVFRDLPGEPASAGRRLLTAPRAARRDQRVRTPWRPPAPVLAIFAVLLVVTVMTHLPLLLLGLGFWVLLSMRRRCR